MLYISYTGRMSVLRTYADYIAVVSVWYSLSMSRICAFPEHRNETKPWWQGYKHRIWKYFEINPLEIGNSRDIPGKAAGTGLSIKGLHFRYRVLFQFENVTSLIFL